MKKTTTKELIEKLEKELNDLQYQLPDHAFDFVEYYKGQEVKYLSDLFSEYADNNTSIYYYQQRNYYNENTDQCLDAIKCNYRSLADFLACFPDIEDLDDAICKAGAIGEYEGIYQELSENEEDIKKCLYIYLLLEELKKKSEYSFFKLRKIFKMILNSDFSNNDHIDLWYLA